MKKKLLLLGALVVLCLGLLTGCGKGKAVSLLDYATVEFTGIDGDGKATVNVDTVKMEQDFAGDEDGQISKEELEKIGQFTQFELSINFSLDKETGLSNGDKVILTVSYDKDLQKESGVKVKGDTTKEIEVSGLKEAVSVDAFDSAVFNTDNGVKLVYEGIAPNAELTIENNCDSSTPQSYVEYSVDKKNNIANGDTLKFTAKLKAGAEEEGYLLKETETTITVEGLDSYVVDVAQLKAEDVKEIQNQMKDLLNTTYQTDGFIPTYINGNLNMYTKGQIGSMSEPVFGDKGFSVPEYALTIFTFNTDLKSVGGFAEPHTDYAGAIGCCTISGLIITADGELIKEDTSEIKIEGIFTDEASMLNQLKSTYQDSLVEGTFTK